MKGYFDPADVSTEQVEILKPDGTVVPDHGFELSLSDDNLRAIWRLMVLTRELDAESTNLQRQGELGVYTPVLGQEAQAGAAFALGPDDWVFPSYRELAFSVHRGIDVAEVLHMFRGTWHGGTFDFREKRIAPYAVPIATQLLHAVGFATAARMDSQDNVAMACFGDGATSEGDFHEACNYAGVWKAPVVFYCQNNQYAISVPLSKQTAAPTLAVRALGYGIPGVRVDGNDVLATFAVVREAVQRARAGKGPTFIEAITYRRGPHSTADDPSRYRSDDELHSWEDLDPIARFTTYATNQGFITEEFQSEVMAEAAKKRTALRTAIVGAPPLDTKLLFEHVYGTPNPSLERQHEQFRRDYLQGS